VLEGADHVTVAEEVSKAVAATLVGASGEPGEGGITELDTAGMPIPIALIPLTVKVYDTPDVSPPNVAVKELVFTTILPGLDVTV
jgi:hypothetical protein